MTGIEFLRPGIHTTIQDVGRYGVQHIGVSVSGAVDRRIMCYVNCKLGNLDNHPVIEFVTVGPEFRVNGNIHICIATDADIKITQKKGSVLKGRSGESYLLHDGDVVKIGACKKHTYGYIGFAHKFLIDPVFGSVSIDTRTSIGPNQGQAFSMHDKLELSEMHSLNAISPCTSIDLTPAKTIKINKGPQWSNFVNTQDFLEKDFSVSKKRNRVGMWLNGPLIKNNMLKDIMSEGIVKGAIQITPSGETVVLLNDHGTTGGYPKIGVVCEEDYEKLAQMPVGHRFNFELVK